MKNMGFILIAQVKKTQAYFEFFVTIYGFQMFNLEHKRYNTERNLR